jgi:hypothetical protein
MPRGHKVVWVDVERLILRFGGLAGVGGGIGTGRGTYGLGKCACG